ncbi:hypothetical protein [Aeromonas veronii]|uniref:hypothetical protein n=1 Tax=Aeromonas veronii TaxID=654 RepID=UPI003D1BDFAB
MMEQYQLFDEYLMKSKAIRAFCEDREKLLFESIRMDIPIDGKIVWLKAVGKEIDEVRKLVEELAESRLSSMTLKE